jgi:hypothetical protein
MTLLCWRDGPTALYMKTDMKPQSAFGRDRILFPFSLLFSSLKAVKP